MKQSGLRPAVTVAEMTSKKLGSEERTVRPVGTKCKAERNGGNMGEFIVWFRNKHYVKVDASKLPDFIKFTDGHVS